MQVAECNVSRAAFALEIRGNKLLKFVQFSPCKEAFSFWFSFYIEYLPLDKNRNVKIINKRNEIFN